MDNNDSILGHVHYDGKSGNNDEIDFLILEKDCERVGRNKYVKIISKYGQKKEYIGRIGSGPFFIPEELSRDSALTQTSILYGNKFPHVPSYYGLGKITLLGEYVEGRLENLSDRPMPQSVVIDLSNEEIAKLLLPTENVDMLWGSLSGYPEVKVKSSSKEKKMLPRNMGIFGTVGSGKTNSSQVIIEEAIANDYAVITIDVEGEYVSMNKSSSETSLHSLLEKFGIKPEGINDFHVYHPVSSEPNTDISKPFTIRTNEIDILNLAELIEASEAQERRLFDVMEEIKSTHTDTEEKRPLSKHAAKPSLSDAISGNSRKYTYDLTTIINWTKKKANDAKGADKSSFWALFGKLNRLNKTGCFDAYEKPSLNIEDMVKPGRLSIIDVSDCYNDSLKNIIIFTTLRKIFDFKLGPEYQNRKVLVVIEEAHSFISRDKVNTMRETLDVLREIARRGRKRWLGLCFISQQPSHLPDEIFELCNTRIIHNLKSQKNINALKYTSGGVTEDLWQTLSTLSAGHALVTSPAFKNSIVMRFRPSKTQRRFVD